MRALLLGSSGLIGDVLGRVMATNGVAVTDDPADPSLSLAVLVDPHPLHWRLAAAAGRPVVVVTSAPVDDAAVVGAVVQGAGAVLPTGVSPDELVAVLATVAAGGVVLTPVQARSVAELARSGRAFRGVELTPREVDILDSIARGESVKQTARVLGICAKTVENLQSRMFRKLNARNRAQAITRAHALGLLEARAS